MELKPGYEQTEVGVIPEDWEITTTSRICELVVDCKNRTPPVVDGGEFAVVRTPNVRNGKFVWDELRFTDEQSYRVWTARAIPQVGDILITREAPLGEACLVPSDVRVCLGQRMMLYRPDREKADSRFLLYALISSGVQGNLLKKIGGSTVGHAKVDDIRNLQIPFPPTLTEQEAIAEALSDADALIESLEQLIAKKRQVKQGAMQELLTGKKRLPGFLEEWEVKKMDEFADIIMGQSPVGSSYNRNEFGAALINGPTEFTEKYPVKIQWTTIPTKFCDKGDVLLCVRGSSTGRINIANDKYCIGRGIAAIRAKSNSVNSFLEFQVQNIVNRILALTAGSTFPNIDGKSLKNIQVALPSVPEQTAIAAILSEMDAEIAALEEKLAKARQVKQGMMQELLTGRIRLVQGQPHPSPPLGREGTVGVDEDGWTAQRTSSAHDNSLPYQGAGRNSFLMPTHLHLPLISPLPYQGRVRVGSFFGVQRMPTRNDWRPSPELWQKLKPLPRQMRKEPTGAEAKLWQHIRKEQIREVKFRRQYVIDRFIADFCSLEVHLILELDGPIHQYTQAEDRIRQAFLESLGFEVLRFPNMEVFDNLRSVLDMIEEVVVRRKNDPPRAQRAPAPLKKGRGLMRDR